MNVLLIYIIYKYMHCFFDTAKIKKSKELTAYGCYFAAGVFARYFVGTSDMPIIDFGLNSIFIWLLSQIYPGKQGKKLLATALICGMNMFCGVATLYLLDSYDIEEAIRSGGQYLSYLLNFMCERLIEKFGIKNMRKDIALKHWDLLIFLPIVCVLLLLVLVVSETKSQYVVAIMGVGMILLNLIVFYICDEMVGAYTKLEESALVERQLESYSNQLEIVMKSEEKIRGLRHDLKHHLSEILMMAEGKRVEDIKSYIKNMQMYMTNEKEYVSSGNTDVDSLLNLMINRAGNDLGNFKCKVCVPQELDIQTFDWNIILGNLLDNAISAAKESDDKLLHINITYQRGILFINIKNSYNGVLIKTADKYISTKEYDKSDNSQVHGLGIKNVKRIVEKYNGSIEINDESGLFDVRLILYTHGRQ